MTLSRLRTLGVALALGVVLAVTVSGPALPIAAASPTPTATATAVPTQTPYPTNTPAATYTPYPSPTATHKPALALSATSGLTTTAIIAAGSDFPPHTAVTLYWDTDAHALATSETDDSGHARLDVTIPADATPGGHEIRAVGADRTSAVALFTVVAGQGYQDSGGSAPHYCLGGLVQWCPDLGGLAGAVFGTIGGALNALVVGLFSPIEHNVSDEWTAMVKPFAHDLTYHPNIADPHVLQWDGLRRFQTALQQLAGVLFFGFLIVGVFARYLEQLGVGDFTQLTSPLRRGVVVTGLILGYPQLMSFGFVALNAATDTINSFPLAHGESAWTAIRGAILAVDNALSFTGILDVIVMIVGWIIVVLAVVVRMFGEGILGGLYIVGPLALALFVSPYFDTIAKSWAKIFISIALWPVGYAVALKLIALMFAAGGPMSEFGGFSAALGALGLTFMLYKMPAIVGGFVGSAGATIGAVASSVTDMGIGTAVSAAKSWATGGLGKARG
jgi:hypothetical protein